MKLKTKKLIETIIENLDTNVEYKKLVDKVLSDVQKSIKLNPKVSLLKIKRIDGTCYLNARTFYPISLNEDKELRVYVGCYEDFPGGIKDEYAKKVAETKMRELIKKKFGL
jgi:hypothetical protein